MEDKGGLITGADGRRGGTAGCRPFTDTPHWRRKANGIKTTYIFAGVTEVVAISSDVSGRYNGFFLGLAIGLGALVLLSPFDTPKLSFFSAFAGKNCIAFWLSGWIDFT